MHHVMSCFVEGKLCLDDHCNTSHYTFVLDTLGEPNFAKLSQCTALCDSLGQPNFGQLTRPLLKLVHSHHASGSHAPTATSLLAVSVFQHAQCVSTCSACWG